MPMPRYFAPHFAPSGDVAGTDMKAPVTIETKRLLIRRPRPGDAESIFSRYSGDPEVTKFVGWPTHTAVDDTKGFLAFCDAEWNRWPAGPYLILSRADGKLLGGTGLGFETASRASTVTCSRGTHGDEASRRRRCRRWSALPPALACSGCMPFVTSSIAPPRVSSRSAGSSARGSCGVTSDFRT
jgi:hypothetical protein